MKDAELKNTIIQRVLDRKNILITAKKLAVVQDLLEKRAIKIAYNPE